MKSKGQDYYESRIDQSFNRKPDGTRYPTWEELPDNEKGENELAALEYERRRNIQT